MSSLSGSSLSGSPVIGQELLARGDLDACRAILARGSKSFALASRALPDRLRDPVAAFYAFCRVSDDLVDESPDARGALESLRSRVDRAARGVPDDDPVDRALAFVMHTHGLPRVTIDALLDGYLWDVERRRYETLSGTLAYSARVASSVGVAMTVLMGVRDRATLARAADLGVAMQLVNIARDVGEDARRGRLYLPLAWMREEGVDPQAFLGSPSPSPALASVVRRVLDHAAILGRRAERGIPALPADCRVAVRAAASIYGDIGRVIRERGYDSVSGRAFTGSARKVWLLARAQAEETIGTADPRGRTSTDRGGDEALPETRFLIDAACS